MWKGCFGTMTRLEAENYLKKHLTQDKALEFLNDIKNIKSEKLICNMYSNIDKTVCCLTGNLLISRGANLDELKFIGSSKFAILEVNRSIFSALIKLNDRTQRNNNSDEAMHKRWLYVKRFFERLSK